MSFPQIGQLSGYYAQMDSAKQSLKADAKQLGVNVTSTESDAFVSGVSAANTVNSNLSASAKKNYTDDEIQAIIDKYMELIITYQAQVEALTAAITELQAQLDEETEKYDFYKEQYDEREDYYNDLQESYEKRADKYEDVANAIEKATEKAEGELKQKQQTAIYNAMANYDESKDGDYQAYLQKSLEGVIDSSSLNGLIEVLSGQSQSLLKEMSSLNLKMSSVAGEMSNWQTLMTYEEGIINQVQSVLTEKQNEETILVNTMDALKAEMANIALSSISDAEMALVTDNGIDLTEKFPDGSPKYIIARGREDNKYHIYELDGPGSNTATSLARKYGNNGGFDIVPNGNGYMYNIERNSGAATVPTTVFSFDSVNLETKEGRASAQQMDYETCSPLSLDVNGDGVKTAEKDIMYDIDGDGILDKIKDSADAVLVFDADGDGVSGENGKECFGNNTDLDGDGIADGYKDGFEALKALAEKENLINGLDDNTLDANDIKLLEEKYGFKIKLNGYEDASISLLDIGITEINLSQTNNTNLNKNFDGQGNDIMTQDGATFKINGEEREYADIWHKKLSIDA